MENILSSKIIDISVSAARLTIAASVAVVICLTVLHILSPEFAPSYRMVSEYALGHYSWLLSLMFCSWAISSWALTNVLSSQVKTKGGKIGLIFLIAAGVGEAMASVFPVPTALHNVAGMIGIPSLPVSAILISISLSHNAEWFPAKKIIMRTAHLTWISFVLMTASMIVMFNGLSKTAGKITPEVIAVGGWANRILIITYCVWVFTVAFQAIRLQKRRDW